MAHSKKKCSEASAKADGTGNAQGGREEFFGLAAFGAITIVVQLMLGYYIFSEHADARTSASLAGKTAASDSVQALQKD